MDFLNPLISAASGLAGVLLGAWLTTRRERGQRRHAFLREQLNDFYAPFYAMRRELQSKGELRVKISGIANDTWVKLFEHVEVPSIKKDYTDRFWPQYQKIIEYNDEQLAGEVIPRYDAMLKLFREKIGLANETTRGHYPALVEFVEIWHRFLAKSLPADVTVELQHDERKLYPLYADIEHEFVRLQNILKDGGPR